MLLIYLCSQFKSLWELDEEILDPVDLSLFTVLVHTSPCGSWMKRYSMLLTYLCS